MKILVMGAGAVGAYFGARMRAAGEDVVLCARGEHLRAIREHGLDITSIRGDLHIDVNGYGLAVRLRAVRSDPVLREGLRHRDRRAIHLRDASIPAASFSHSRWRRERGKARGDLRPRRRDGR